MIREDEPVEKQGILRDLCAILAVLISISDFIVSKSISRTHKDSKLTRPDVTGLVKASIDVEFNWKFSQVNEYKVSLFCNLQV